MTSTPTPRRRAETLLSSGYSGQRSEPWICAASTSATGSACIALSRSAGRRRPSSWRVRLGSTSATRWSGSSSRRRARSSTWLTPMTACSGSSCPPDTPRRCSTRRASTTPAPSGDCWSRVCDRSTRSSTRTETAAASPTPIMAPTSTRGRRRSRDRSSHDSSLRSGCRPCPRSTRGSWPIRLLVWPTSPAEAGSRASPSRGGIRRCASTASTSTRRRSNRLADISPGAASRTGSASMSGTRPIPLSRIDTTS